MKKAIVIIPSLLVVFALSAQKSTKQAPVVGGTMSKIELKNGIDSASYAYGMILAQNMTRQMSPDLKQDIVLAAVNASFKNDSTLIRKEEAQRIFGEFNRLAQAKIAEQNRIEGEKAKGIGQAFLAKNKTRKEVTTTASGLQYEVITKGANTVSPKATDKVKVHYHGTLIDGLVFDSSVERGQPAAFGLNQVIKGWTEGLQYMHVGDKFRFFIPSELAYGDKPAGQKIKPNSTLIFEVELLEIQ
jgi:FKBP-type peptidyl-prolyl cis-trans isomerase FklB